VVKVFVLIALKDSPANKAQFSALCVQSDQFPMELKDVFLANHKEQQPKRARLLAYARREALGNFLIVLLVLFWTM
jgi:hypothetical protein